MREVRLREVPRSGGRRARLQRRLVADALREGTRALREAMQRDGLVAVGAPQWARYNSPFSLPFMRRNEIWIEIDSQ